MMEESGIETTPPGTPPLTLSELAAAAAVSSTTVPLGTWICLASSFEDNEDTVIFSQSIKKTMCILELLIFAKMKGKSLF